MKSASSDAALVSYALVVAQLVLIARLASPLGAFVPDSPGSLLGALCLLGARYPRYADYRRRVKARLVPGLL